MEEKGNQQVKKEKNRKSPGFPNVPGNPSPRLNSPKGNSTDSLDDVASILFLRDLVRQWVCEGINIEALCPPNREDDRNDALVTTRMKAS
jgi:hypothetical protein